MRAANEDRMKAEMIVEAEKIEKENAQLKIEMEQLRVMYE